MYEISHIWNGFLHRVMFWTESRYTGVPKVVKSNLDGTQCVALVASSLTDPWGITLDGRNKVVFWVDFSTGDIECVDYGGNNRRLLVTFPSTSDLWGVTFASSYLFVTSPRNCHKVDASNGSVVRKFPMKPAERSYGLVAFDSSLQASGLRFNSTIKDIGKSKRWVKVQY